MSDKMWGGRFSGQTDELMERFNASYDFDRRLYAADIRGSIAYATALSRCGLITEEEADQIIAGLRVVWAEFDDGTFERRPGDEDIHTAVERRLGEIVGSVAGKLHTGRSRNDQAATDVRIFLAGKIDDLARHLRDLQTTILRKAESHLGLIMPGYTHLQQAQPVMFSHWLLSFFWMFQRDGERLSQLKGRVSVLPLGSGALAGHSFGIDRDFLAEQLGFETVSQNSLDAVGSRDHLLEFLSWAAIAQTHLSRLAEDLIIWSTREFGFLEIDDAYSTGSSLMPQKKNPDSLELVRGKTGRVVGNLTALLTTVKGLPSAYNKDLQEDKEPVFDTIDTLEMVLPIVTGVVDSLQVNGARMKSAVDDGVHATDLADYLVQCGVPFREAHHLVGQVVRQALESDVSLRDLPLEDYQRISERFGDDVYQVFDLEQSVDAKTSPGGTSESAVRKQIHLAREALAGR